MTIDPKDVFDNKIQQYTLTSETEKMGMKYLAHTHLYKVTYTHTR